MDSTRSAQHPHISCRAWPNRAGRSFGFITLASCEAWPSEGGHVDFAPRSELEIELLQWAIKDVEALQPKRDGSVYGAPSSTRTFKAVVSSGIY